MCDSGLARLPSTRSAAASCSRRGQASGSATATTVNGQSVPRADDCAGLGPRCTGLGYRRTAHRRLRTRSPAARVQGCPSKRLEVDPHHRTCAATEPILPPRGRLEDPRSSGKLKTGGEAPRPSTYVQMYTSPRSRRPLQKHGAAPGAGAPASLGADDHRWRCVHNRPTPRQPVSRELYRLRPRGANSTVHRRRGPPSTGKYAKRGTP